VTTVGASEALCLCLRAVAQAGDTVAIESPAYFGVLQMIESLKMRALEIPSMPGKGIDLDALEEALASHKIKACVVSPTISNPLGCVMSDAASSGWSRCWRAASAADRGRRVWRPVLRASPAAAGQGVRRARAGDAVLVVLEDAGAGVPGRVDGAGPVPRSGRGAEVRAERGDADAAAAGDRGLHRERRLRAPPAGAAAQAGRAGAAGQRGDRRALPGGDAGVAAGGGFVLWVELPPGTSALALHDKALAQAISVAPGPIFSAKTRFSNCIRMSCGYPWSDLLEHAVRTLGRIAREVADRPGPELD
jgi:hypothetical protein